MKITYDYPMAAAKVFASLRGDRFNFVYVSALGCAYASSLCLIDVFFRADPTEKSSALFAKVKGRTETHLLALPTQDAVYSSLRVYNVRPAMIDDGAAKFKDTRPRPFPMRVMNFLKPVFRVVLPSYMIAPTGLLSQVLVDLAVGDGGPLKSGPGIEAAGRTLESSAIRRWAEIRGGNTKAVPVEDRGL